MFLSSNMNSSHLQYSWSHDEQRNQSTINQYTIGNWYRTHVFYSIFWKTTFACNESSKWSTKKNNWKRYQWNAFPNFQTERLGRSNIHNINSFLVTYATALQKESTPSTIQFLQLAQNAYKRHIRASYDIKNEASFPVIEHKKKKPSTKHITDTNDTPATISITNDDCTIVSSFPMTISWKF